MKINYVAGDLFAQIKNIQEPVIIPHVCNDIGKWGAGFVVPLGRHFPVARDEYTKWFASGTGFGLGEIQKVIVCNNLCVINMVAQRGVGGKRPIVYSSLGKCIELVREFIRSSFNGSIYCPMFGAGLAGGNWSFIEEMIEDGWCRFNIPVTVCYLPGQTPPGWTPGKSDE